MVVTLTHAIPALILYYPVFLLAAAFIIKFRRPARNSRTRLKLQCVNEQSAHEIMRSTSATSSSLAQVPGWSCWGSTPMAEQGVASCQFESTKSLSSMHSSAELGCANGPSGRFVLSEQLRMASNSFVAVVSIQPGLRFRCFGCFTRRRHKDRRNVRDRLPDQDHDRLHHPSVLW